MGEEQLSRSADPWQPGGRRSNQSSNRGVTRASVTRQFLNLTIMLLLYLTLMVWLSLKSSSLESRLLYAKNCPFLLQNKGLPVILRKTCGLSYKFAVFVFTSVQNYIVINICN